MRGLLPWDVTWGRSRWNNIKDYTKSFHHSVLINFVLAFKYQSWCKSQLFTSTPGVKFFRSRLWAVKHERSFNGSKQHLVSESNNFELHLGKVTLFWLFWWVFLSLPSREAKVISFLSVLGLLFVISIDGIFVNSFLVY